jgi:hypothetical protein
MKVLTEAQKLEATQRRESHKRVRGAVRTEASIIADAILDALLPAVDDAVTELRAPVVGTDWVRVAIVKGIDQDKLKAVALDAIRAAHQDAIGSGS